MKTLTPLLITFLFLTGCSEHITHGGKDANTSGETNTTTSDTTLSPGGEVIHGHVLPPEPDPAVNNATLLGVDVNNNDVRDDVERWIYETYKDKHPVYVDIAMQAGRAYKKVLEMPEKAKEIHDEVNAPYFCASYYQNYAQYFNDSVLVHERIDTPVKSEYFNTKERSEAYWEYDERLSGDSYPLPELKAMKAQCDFNTSKFEE